MEKRKDPQRLEPFRLRLDKTQNAAFPLVMATYNGEIAQVSTILNSMVCTFSFQFNKSNN